MYVIHCVCHRLALILSDAINGTAAYDPVIPEGVVSLLNMLHAYFSKSAKRKYALRMLINDKNKATLEARQKAQEEAGRVIPAVNAVRNPHDDLEAVLSVLEERHKLPRRIVLTRWLSSADAVRVVLTSRGTYALFFSHETSNKADTIRELLEDNCIVAWYACLQDVLPVLTGLNVLFQSTLPLPHLLYRHIVAARSTLINMVGPRGASRDTLIPIDLVKHDTLFGAYANNFLAEHGPATGTPLVGLRLSENEILRVKKLWHKLFSHCVEQINVRFPPESMEMFQLVQGDVSFTYIFYYLVIFLYYFNNIITCLIALLKW